MAGISGFDYSAVNAINQAGANMVNAAGTWAAGNEHHKQREWNEKMYYASLEESRKDAETAYNRTRALYDQYATISAQVRDMQDAGLNPALYGQANAGSPNVSQATEPASPQMGYDSSFSAALSDLGSRIVDNNLKRAQTDNLVAQTEKQNIDNNFSKDTYDDKVLGVRSEAAKAALSKFRDEYQLDIYTHDLNAFNILGNALTSDDNKAVLSRDIEFAKRDILDIQRKYADNKEFHTLQGIMNNNALTLAEKESKIADANLTTIKAQYESEVKQATIRLLGAQTYAAEQQGDLANTQAEAIPFTTDTYSAGAGGSVNLGKAGSFGANAKGEATISKSQRGLRRKMRNPRY